MKTAGVLIFTGGLDDAAPVFSVDASSGTPLFTDGPYIETMEHLGGFAVVDVADEEAARLWAGKLAVPAVGRKRCDVSWSRCSLQRFLDGVGGRSYCEPPPRILGRAEMSAARSSTARSGVSMAIRGRYLCSSRRRVR
jgi:hypothetical protein